MILSRRCIAATLPREVLPKSQFFLHPHGRGAIFSGERQDSVRECNLLGTLAREFAEFAKNIFKTKVKRGETMTRRLVSGCLAGALVTVFAGSVAAQVVDPKGYVAGTAPCSMGYACSGYPTPTDGVVKSAVYNGTKGLAGN